MATSTPTPAWSDVNFVENGEDGEQSVLNRPLYTLDNKAEWLKSTITLHISSAECLASKLGEQLGSDCLASSCLPCWGSPSNFAANDTYKSAISKLDAVLATKTTSIVSLAQAEDRFETYTGIPINTAVSVFNGHSFIDGLTHRQALSTLDDVAATNSDLIASHASHLSVHASSLVATSTAVSTAQSTAVAVSLLANNNASSLVTLDNAIDALSTTITDTVLASQASIYTVLASVVSIINCLMTVPENSNCSVTTLLV